MLKIAFPPHASRGPALPGLRNTRRFFALSLALLSAALGWNRFFYFAFCCCAATAVLLLFLSPPWGSPPHPATKAPGADAPQRAFRLPVRTTCLLMPLSLILYTALTPGQVLKDLPIAAKMLTAWVIGLAASQLARPTLATSLFFLPAVLALSVLFGAVSLYFGTAERLSLGFSHPNVFGEVAAWAVLLAMSLYGTLPAKLKIPAVVAGVCCAGGIVLAVSRSAMLGLTAGTLFLLRSGIGKTVLTALLFCLALSLSAALVLPASEYARVRTALQTPLADPTFRSRLPIWEAAWTGFLRSPLLGNGARSFEADHSAYVREHKEVLLRKYGVAELRIGNPHQLFLGLLYMYGLAGSALFGVTFLSGLFRAWRERDNVFLASIFFVCGHGLVEFGLHRKDGIFILFFPLGLSCGRALAEAARRKKSPCANVKSN